MIDAMWALYNAGGWSTYVVTHAANMASAHRGSAFPPWHRQFILQFERDLQAAVGDSCLRLPYWDWTNAASTAGVLNAAWFGTNGAAPGFLVADGQFADTTAFKVYTRLGVKTTSGIQRRTAVTVPALPTGANVAGLMGEINYDAAPWDATVALGLGFRNHLEGWPGGPLLHNRVHVWVGGAMAMVPTAPNDPIFFLHHCNVDRLWSIWQALRPGAPYLPAAPGAGVPPNHDLMAFMPPWNAAAPATRVRPFDVLNTRALGYYYV